MRRIFELWLFGVLAAGLGCFGAPANSNAQNPTWLIGKNASWKYSAGVRQPPADWKQAAFDDQTWPSGPAGFGFGDADDSTVLDDMQGRYTAIYIRTHFDLPRPEEVDSLYLYVNYDDGFLTYLNGRQVAAASVKQEAGGIRVEQHEARGYETFVIRDVRSLLKPGRNTLAIEGHNATLDSSDFSLDPLLATRKLDVPAATFAIRDYLADIDELERRLLDQSSYLTRLQFDCPTAIADLRRSINDRTQLARFVHEVQKLVMQIGDCHAGVRSSIPLPASAQLPARLADTAEGVAALSINLDQPLDVDCPYLESIDGLPLERWLSAAAAYVPRGSPQLVRRRSLALLGEVPFLRDELNLPASDVVTIGLRSADRVRHATARLRLTKQGSAVARVRISPTRMLDGNIGYLRLSAMDDRLVESSVARIQAFRDTRGLIIDVRDNGGGTYGLLRGIYGFFVPADAKPHVTNIAAYRLSSAFARDHLAYRPTYRADWEGWSEPERAAIRQAAADFVPQWMPPAGKFSEWHYMVLGRERSGRRGPANDYFYYDKPVVVLSNAGSFSATDGFLNAMADLPQVTIVGEPSAGGSGGQRSFQLPKTRLNITLSSMASFRPNGQLFDGHGIEVDIAVQPTLADYITPADSVLKQAVALIQERSR